MKYYFTTRNIETTKYMVTIPSRGVSYETVKSVDRSPFFDNFDDMMHSRSLKEKLSLVNGFEDSIRRLEFFACSDDAQIIKRHTVDFGPQNNMSEEDYDEIARHLNVPLDQALQDDLDTLDDSIKKPERVVDIVSKALGMESNRLIEKVWLHEGQRGHAIKISCINEQARNAIMSKAPQQLSSFRSINVDLGYVKIPFVVSIFIQQHDLKWFLTSLLEHAHYQNKKHQVSTQVINNPANKFRDVYFKSFHSDNVLMVSDLAIHRGNKGTAVKICCDTQETMDSIFRELQSIISVSNDLHWNPDGKGARPYVVSVLLPPGKDIEYLYQVIDKKGREMKVRPSRETAAVASPSTFFGSTAPASASSARRVFTPTPSSATVTSSKTEGVEIPHEFKCPISLELMTNPVLCTLDGQTYEKAYIEEALKVDRKSPHNRNPMSDGATIASVLVPNFAIKHLIDDFNEKNAVKKAPGSSIK